MEMDEQKKKLGWVWESLHPFLILGVRLRASQS